MWTGWIHAEPPTLLLMQPLFSGAPENAVRRVFRIEYASRASVEWSLDPEQAWQLILAGTQDRERTATPRCCPLAQSPDKCMSVAGIAGVSGGNHGFAVDHVETESARCPMFKPGGRSSEHVSWIHEHRPVFLEVQLGASRECCEVNDDVVAFGHAHADRARNDWGRSRCCCCRHSRPHLREADAGASCRQWLRKPSCRLNRRV